MRNTLLGSVVIFVVFFAYYLATGTHLPRGAGPDYRAHNDIVNFIHSHKRLPVLAQDEEQLHFTAYGGTRALRPPLSYVVSAAMVTFTSYWEAPRTVMYRRGSAFLAALTVAVTFYAVGVFFHSIWYGFAGALLFGLLPQFTFIASYNNDDVGAIFTATLLLASLITIYKWGLSWLNVVFLSVACGLVLVSKQSAWLLGPTVILFFLALVRVPLRSLARYAGVGAVIVILSGGWWILFNMHHYGVGDPFLTDVTREVAERHTQFPETTRFGFQARGIGYADLLWGNHDDFWRKTIASTIGNLDWLRLRMGPWQYGLYLTVFLGALLYFVASTVEAVWRSCSVRLRTTVVWRRHLFEALLVFALCFQIAAYVWTNVNNDIQMQGKYLLPVFLAVIVLFLSAFRVFGGRLVAGAANAYNRVEIPINAARSGLYTAAIILLVGVHVHALVRYVVPFYKSTDYNAPPPIAGIQLTDVRAVDLQKVLIAEKSPHVRAITQNDRGVVIQSSGVDPWFVLDVEEAGLCAYFGTNLWLQVGVQAEKGGKFKVYVNRGNGFREADAHRLKYDAGSTDLVFLISAPKCLPLRLDPRESKGWVTITNIAVAGMKIIGKE